MCSSDLRVYPQGNDGNTDLYSVFRCFVQKEIATILGVENRWEVKKERVNVASHGTHYRDYLYNGNCNATYLKAIGYVPTREIEIGHAGICTYCGEEYSSNGTLSHGDCVTLDDWA